jgi:hypothetical protein
MHIAANMGISVNQALSMSAMPARGVTFEQWRRALRGQPLLVMPSVATMLAPAELPPLPPVALPVAPSAPAASQAKAVTSAMASVSTIAVVAPLPVWTVKGRLPIAPVPVVTPDDEYPDPTAIWNASPSRVEVFLSRYHHQTFTAFAIAALVLLWVM